MTPTLGDWVTIKHGSKCAPEVWGMSGKVVHVPSQIANDICYVVQFPQDIPPNPAVANADCINRPQPNQYKFWDNELEFHPFVSAMLIAKEND